MPGSGISFRRIHGRVVPIRSKETATEKDFKETHERAKRVAYGLGATSGALGHFALSTQLAMGPRGNGLALGLAAASGAVGFSSLAVNGYNARKVANKSEGKRTGLGVFAGLYARSVAANLATRYAGGVLIGPSIKATKAAARAAESGLKATKAWSETVAEARRFKNAKMVYRPVSGFLTGGR